MKNLRFCEGFRGPLEMLLLAGAAKPGRFGQHPDDDATPSITWLKEFDMFASVTNLLCLGKRGRIRPAAKRPRRAALALESLEDRMTPSSGRLFLGTNVGVYVTVDRSSFDAGSFGLESLSAHDATSVYDFAGAQGGITKLGSKLLIIQGDGSYGDVARFPASFAQKGTSNASTPTDVLIADAMPTSSLQNGISSASLTISGSISDVVRGGDGRDLLIGGLDDDSAGSDWISESTHESSGYTYAFSGTCANSAYNGSADERSAVGRFNEDRLTLSIWTNHGGMDILIANTGGDRLGDERYVYVFMGTPPAPELNVGDTFVFTITVTNNGYDAAGLLVSVTHQDGGGSDVIFVGLGQDDSAASIGSGSPNRLLFRVDQMPANDGDSKIDLAALDLQRGR